MSVRVREARPADASALRGLAGRDSVPQPAGEVLVAEVDGELIAAVAVASGRAVARPLGLTDVALALLRIWADRVRAAA